MDTHLGTGAHRVVITGTGAVTAFGVGCTRFLQGMQAGACALKMQTIGNAGRSDDIVVGHVQDYDPTAYFSGPDLMYRDPFAQYALLATREAMAEAGLQRPSAETAHRYAVILGTGGGGEVAREDAGIDIFVHKKKRINPVVVPKTNHQASVGLISMEYGFTGPSMTINTGCASGSHAFIQSVINLRHGYADVAITGGSEGNAVFSVLLAFKSARTLSQDTCRPFSKERSGFILGEGAGVLVLETLAHALKRGATPLAEVIGCGMSSDAGDIVRPSVQGPVTALRRVFEEMQQSGCHPDDVDYVNAHGTGTVVNDPIEIEAMQAAFGARADTLPISSTKSAVGHTLGAAGGIELVASTLALQHGFIPPTVNFLTPDPACPIDCVPNTARTAKLNVVLSQNFAFGGVNGAVALGRI